MLLSQEQSQGDLHGTVELQRITVPHLDGQTLFVKVMTEPSIDAREGRLRRVQLELKHWLLVTYPLFDKSFSYEDERLIIP